MSERLTSIRLANFNDYSGIAEWGLKTHEEMLIKIKDYAKSQRDIFDAILNAKDEDFITETYIGVHVMKNKTVVLPLPKEQS